MIRPWRLEAQWHPSTRWGIWGSYSTKERAELAAEKERERLHRLGTINPPILRVKARDGWQQ